MADPTVRGKSERRRVSARTLVLALVCGAVLAVVWRTRSGIEVNVRNEENVALHDVEVVTTAGSYALGDLGAGESASTLVGALGESSLSMTWRSSDGSRHEVAADVYFEGSPDGTGPYSGRVEFVVAGGTARPEAHVGLTLNPIPRGWPPRARR